MAQITGASDQLNPRQREANRLLGSVARHILLYGGSRSGKTFLLCRAIAIRALKAPKSSHVIARLHLSHLKASVVYDTWPKMMATCFPGIACPVNKADWFGEFKCNGSRVWFAGLDDKDRVEKILGQEHSTVFLNECSQISYDARNMLLTRMAQKSGLALKAYYDCNPPRKTHWTYALFRRLIEPKTGAPIERPNLYAAMQLNPRDNAAHLADGYLDTLEALPARERRRFLEGEFQDAIEGALWTLESFQRAGASGLPPMRRIVVAVDPSGCAGPEDTRSDEIGIIVAGRDAPGNGYVLADLSGRYSPEGWAKAAVDAFDRHQADAIVAERNFGGEMVAATIRAVRREAPPVRLVTASRGKAQRAEPVAALYERKLVVHAGAFPDLEDQLCGFSTGGWQGARSPDRADAAIWALTELMLGPGGPAPIVAPIIVGQPRNPAARNPLLSAWP